MLNIPLHKTGGINNLMERLDRVLTLLMFMQKKIMDIVRFKCCLCVDLHPLRESFWGFLVVGIIRLEVLPSILFSILHKSTLDCA